MGDAGYIGVQKREEYKDRDVDWFIALRAGKRTKLHQKQALINDRAEDSSFRYSLVMNFLFEYI